MDFKQIEVITMKKLGQIGNGKDKPIPIFLLDTGDYHLGEV